MRNSLFVFLVLFFVVAFVGCDSEKKVASAVPERYFELVKEGRFEELPPLYSTAFFHGIPKVALVRSIEGINYKIGRLKKYKLLSWNHTRRPRTKGGDKFKFLYEVQYSKESAKESFTVSSGRDGKYKITDHKLYSKTIKQ